MDLNVSLINSFCLTLNTKYLKLLDYDTKKFFILVAYYVRKNKVGNQKIANLIIYTLMNEIVRILGLVQDPLIDYYLEYGIPLLDYDNIIQYFENMEQQSYDKQWYKDISIINDGCNYKNIDIIDFLTNLLETSPDIISLDLSNCDLFTWPRTLAVQEVLRRWNYIPDLIDYIMELLVEFKKLQVIRLNTNFFEDKSTQLLRYPYLSIQETYKDIYKHIKSDLPNLKITNTAYNSWKSFYTEFKNWFNDTKSDIPLWKLAGFPHEVMVNDFLDRGFNPQEGYDSFLEQLIEHFNFIAFEYIHEFGIDNNILIQDHTSNMKNLRGILKLFLNRDINPRLERLITYHLDDHKEDEDPAYFENEASRTRVKGRIIDILYEINPLSVTDEQLDKYLPDNWNEIKPLDIYDDGGGAGNVYEDKPLDIEMWQQYKNDSKRLREFIK